MFAPAPSAWTWGKPEENAQPPWRRTLKEGCGHARPRVSYELEEESCPPSIPALSDCSLASEEPEVSKWRATFAYSGTSAYFGLRYSEVRLLVFA